MTANPSQLPVHYRPDIDGLRALSVVLVVLFHAGLGFPGGFIGVDVFFVISGYLITGIIVRGIENQNFSLFDFYCRRVRRIFPALAVFLVVVLLVGYRCFLPNDFEQLGKASIYQSFFAANYFFWQEAGYFSRDLATKPLLHTWSLAVEEQFYLLYPTLLFVLFRRRDYSRTKALAIVACIGMGSFVLNLYGIIHHPSFTFYALPTRAWELMAGAALAISACSISNRLIAELLGWGGILAIVLASLMFSEQTAFPGAWALLPTAGAVAFIAANTAASTTSARVLSWRPVVFVGLISYSLYLWHWAVLAFLRYLVKEPTSLMIGIAISASVVLATLSWWWVEQPIRKRRIAVGNRSLLAGSLALWSLVLLASVVITRSDGLPGRFDPTQAALIEDATWNGMEFVRTTEQIEADHPVRLGIKVDPTRRGGFLLWGDSHAAMLCQMVDTLATRQGKFGFATLHGGTPPVPNLWRTGMPTGRSFNQAVMQFIDRQQISDVILVSRWSVYVNGYSPWDPTTDGRKNDDVFLADSSQPSRSGMESLQAMQRQLSLLVPELDRKNVRVWLLKQVPSQQSLVAENAVRNMLLGADVNQILPTHIALHTEQQNMIGELYQSIDQSIQATGGRILDPATVLFDSDGRSVLHANGRYTYRDDDHLSKSGAELLAPILTQVMQQP